MQAGLFYFYRFPLFHNGYVCEKEKMNDEMPLQKRFCLLFRIFNSLKI